MSKTVRGKRDGTGSRVGSYMQIMKKIGRRRAAGIKCPVKKGGKK